MIKRLEQITIAFEDFDEDGVLELVLEELDSGGDPLELLKELSAILEDLGEKFSTGEIYLPQLFQAGKIAEKVNAPLIEKIKEMKFETTAKGTVLLASVQGDVHDIGKNMVNIMMKASGFEVIDLGVNVPAQSIIDSARKNKVDIIALSSTMTSTIPMMEDIIDMLEATGMRSNYQIMVGGGSLTEEVARDIGADGYGSDANEAAKKAKELMSNIVNANSGT